jgi:hypothetical protein
VIDHPLELNITILIEHAGSVSEIFNQIKDGLPSSLKEMIQPAAYLEDNGPKLFSAQSRLVARETQKNSTVAEGQSIQEIISVKKIVDLLIESVGEINKELATLNEERILLLARVKVINETMLL